MPVAMERGLGRVCTRSRSWPLRSQNRQCIWCCAQCRRLACCRHRTCPLALGEGALVMVASVSVGALVLVLVALVSVQVAAAMASVCGGRGI